MTAVTVTDRSALAAALRSLKLSGMLPTLDARLAQAHAGELGHLDFLQVLCQDEISRRDSMSLQRRIRRARFENEATLEGFDFNAAPKLPAAQIRDLAALRWLAGGSPAQRDRAGPGRRDRRVPAPDDHPAGSGSPGGLAGALRRHGYPHVHSPACPHVRRGLSSVFTQIIHRPIHRALLLAGQRAAGEHESREKAVIPRYTFPQVGGR
jgi:IstB-like ATP binding protein